MQNFTELAESRKAWISDILQPWCETVPRKELIKAGAEWLDIAGRVDVDATLWTWAWSRFPTLVHEGLSGVNETREVTVTLNDGRRMTGFPDGRQSKQGMLVLLIADADSPAMVSESEPVSIDDIASVEAAS